MSCPENACATGPRATAMRAVRTVQETAQAAKLPLLNGALTRFGVVLALFPLDVAKTRAQMRTHRWVPNPGKLMRGPGYLLRDRLHVFRGAPVAVLGAAGAGAVSYIAYAALQRSRPPAATPIARRPARKQPVEEKPDGILRRNALTRNIALAEAAAALWLVPLESAKVRVQAGINSSSMRALAYAFRGPQGWFAGAGAHLARDLPARALSITAVALAARWVAKLGEKKDLGKWNPVAETALAGGIVGAATAPLDLIRTRIMAQRIGSGALYSNFLSCGFDLARKEGPFGLLRGVAPRTAYMALSAGLFAVGFEYAERTLKEKQWLWYRPDVWVEDDRGKARKKA